MSENKEETKMPLVMLLNLILSGTVLSSQKINK